MSDRPVLATERLHIRPLAIDDADALHTMYADADAMRWWSHPPHATLEETHDRLAVVIAAPDWRAWAITLQDDDRAIGMLVAHEKRQGRVVEIGYSLVREHWGRGLAREAVTALIDRLFAEGHRRVFADTDPDNAASRHLLESLGFQLEGVLRAEWETHIGVRDTALYGLLVDEWPSSSAATRAGAACSR